MAKVMEPFKKSIWEVRSLPCLAFPSPSNLRATPTDTIPRAPSQPCTA